jgi:hypothetical protein
VTAHRNGNVIDVTFTGGAVAKAKLKAGASVEARCQALTPQPSLMLADDDVPEGGRVPARGTLGIDGVAHLAIASGAGKPLDTCDVATGSMIAAVGLTPAGVAWVDEGERADAMRHRLVAAHGASGYKPAAALGAGVVPMASPDGTPPTGQIGYWTDGTRATVAELSAAGRRLVMSDTGHVTLRTNVLQQGDVLGAYDDLATPASGDAGEGKKPGGDEDPGGSPFKRETPLMSADGVNASRSGRRVTLRFSGHAAAAFRALGGRRVSVGCEPVSAPALFPRLVVPDPAIGIAIARVPRRGGRVTATLRGGTGDVCVMVDDDVLVAVVAATPAGVRMFQDLKAIALVVDADTDHITAAGGKAYKTTTQIVAAHRKTYVALPGADAAPPVGRLGVWTDGARRGVLAARSASGRVVRLVDEGDGTARTNVFGMLSEPALTFLFLVESS